VLGDGLSTDDVDIAFDVDDADVADPDDGPALDSRAEVEVPVGKPADDPGSAPAKDPDTSPEQPTIPEASSPNPPQSRARRVSADGISAKLRTTCGGRS
jgi:hypothetical protein